MSNQSYGLYTNLPDCTWAGDSQPRIRLRILISMPDLPPLHAGQPVNMQADPNVPVETSQNPQTPQA